MNYLLTSSMKSLCKSMKVLLADYLSSKTRTKLLLEI
jgi:hypothetical protein